MEIIRHEIKPDPEGKARFAERLIEEGIELYGPFWKAVWQAKAYQRAHGRHVSWLASAITIHVLRRDVPQK